MRLLYDTELALGKDANRQRRVVGKLYSVGTFSAAISAALCSMVLLAGGINEVVWVQAIIGWGPLCVVYFLVEAPRRTSRLSLLLPTLLIGRPLGKLFRCC